jgi:hypothetical protein
MDAPQAPQASAGPTAMPITSAPPSGQPTDREVIEFLAWRYDRLHTLFQFAVAGLIILSLAINVFLYKQMRLVRIQLPAQRDATIRYAMDFHKKDDQTIRAFVNRLQQFASTNADFQPILDQYRTPLSSYFLSVPQKATPAPTPAAAAPSAPKTSPAKK